VQLITEEIPDNTNYENDSANQHNVFTGLVVHDDFLIPANFRFILNCGVKSN
jgi:hypothetical protein